MKFYINLNKLLRSGGRAKIRTDTTNSTTTTTTTTAPTTTTTTTTASPTTTTTAAPLVGYTLSGSEDFSGNYTISGTYNGEPAWQHETKNYLMYFVGESSGWAAFPGTIASGPTQGPMIFQACGYPCGGNGTCTVGSIIGDYCGGGNIFTITQAGGATTTAAPTTTTTTAAPSGVFTLSGAGTSAVNGCYSEAGTYNGKPYYSNGTYFVWYEGYEWTWFINQTVGTGGPLYYGESETNVPNAWYKNYGSGQEPAPTHTTGAC